MKLDLTSIIQSMSKAVDPMALARSIMGDKYDTYIKLAEKELSGDKDPSSSDV